MTLEINKRRSPPHLRALCIIAASALSIGATLHSPTAHARFQPPRSTPEDANSVPVFVEIDTTPLAESEQPADAAEADALMLQTRLPELLEQRGVELAESAGSGSGHLRVSIGWKYYKESIYQVHVIYTGPDGAESTSDWTIEGIDSGDVVDEFNARLDKYEAWFSAPSPDDHQTTAPPSKPNKAWLAMGISGAALAVVGGALALTGAVLNPEERLDPPTASDGSLGQPGTDDNGTRRALVYSGVGVAGVGVALAAVGFSLHFSKKNKGKRAQRTSIAPILGRGVAGLSATGRF